MSRTRRNKKPSGPIKERKPLPARSGEYHVDRKKAENKRRARGRVIDND